LKINNSILKLFNKFAPKIYESVVKKEKYETAPKISIDYAIMEKKERLSITAPGMGDQYIGQMLIRTQKNDANTLISIEDNGAGIPVDKKEQIFDPFYTTRPPGQGTGLGFSISHKIMAEHGGRIWADNAPGGGAQFFIELPFNRKLNV